MTPPRDPRTRACHERKNCSVHIYFPEATVVGLARIVALYTDLFEVPFMLRLFRLWRLGGQDLGLLWYALRHPGRPAWLIPALALLGIYALEPANFAIPLLGVVDDLVLLPLLLHAMARFLPAEIRSSFERRGSTL